jgi:hypothetical protein
MSRYVINLWGCDENKQVHPDLLSILPSERNTVETGPVARMEMSNEFIPFLDHFLFFKILQCRHKGRAEVNDYFAGLPHESIVVFERLYFIIVDF